MPDRTPTEQEEFRDAFLTNERQERIRTGKVACVLVAVLMPAGSTMDWWVYPKHFFGFLGLRLICSVLAAFLWYLHTTEFGQQRYRWLGIPIALLPAIFMSWMIAVTDGALSHYYAALNLILLAVSVVVRWKIWESIISVVAIILMYLAACAPNSYRINQEPPHDLLLNLYFVTLTGIIVVTGNHLFTQLRNREFRLRFELEQNRKALESSLQQLKETEMQLVQSEKLASLGRMSAGIIHEINNPLNFATTGLYMLRNKGQFLAPEQQEEYAEVLKDVEEGIKRVTSIVSDLRTFSHPDAGQRDQVEVAEVVAAALRFLSNEWKDIVQIETTIARQQTIWVNKNKIIHVLVNLLQNSLDAMKGKSFDGEKPAIQITGRVENGRSILSIRDNGPGIDAKHLDKVFDPFYTTKEVGAGMGLGLSICHRIVQEYDGKISVSTEPGRFCEITLEFPEKG
jgi:two-component system sensor histidine kinase PhcS